MNWEEIKNTLWDVLVNGGWTLLKLVGIFIIGYIIIRIVKRILRKILNKSPMDALAKKFIFRTVVVVLYSVLVLILIQIVGIPVTGLIAALTALGVAVGLALQDSLSSLANGVILIITKPFKENDVVNVNGIEGKVKAINFFNTIIDTWDNRRVIIPNKNMINYQIENTNYHDKRRFNIKFKVPFGTDIKKLREVTKAAMLSHKMVFTEPAPALWVKDISQEGISVEARAWALSDDCDVVSWEMNETLFNELKRNGFEIAQNKMLVFLEERDKKPYFDPTPLPDRDLTMQPKSQKVEDLTFDEVLDGIVLKPIKGKKKIKNKQKIEENNKQKFKKESIKLQEKENNQSKKFAENTTVETDLCNEKKIISQPADKLINKINNPEIQEKQTITDLNDANKH